MKFGHQVTLKGLPSPYYSQDVSSIEPQWPQAPGVPGALQTNCPERCCRLQKSEGSETLRTKPKVSSLKKDNQESRHTPKPQTCIYFWPPGVARSRKKPLELESEAGTRTTVAQPSTWELLGTANVTERRMSKSRGRRGIIRRDCLW